MVALNDLFAFLLPPFILSSFFPSHLEDMRTKMRAFGILGKCSTTKLHAQPIFSYFLAPTILSVSLNPNTFLALFCFISFIHIIFLKNYITK